MIYPLRFNHAIAISMMPERGIILSKTRRLILVVLTLVTALPMMIAAQDNPYPPAQPYYGELIDYDALVSEYQAGKLLTEADVPLPSDVNEADIPLPSDINEADIPLPSDINEADIPLPGDINEADVPSPNDLTEADIPLPNVPTTVPPTTTRPPQPITLIAGFYKQVGEPSVALEGTCFDASVDAKGSCAANGGASNEVNDFNNCWSNDPNSPTNSRSELGTPVCQSDDRQSLFISNTAQWYGLLASNAYGIGSVDRQLLQQGGVTVGSYGVIIGTQVEILSPTRFVVKYVHREQNGCQRVVSVYYELNAQSEAACQQIIEVAPTEQPQEPISVPPPLPPIEENAPYYVAMPILPAECTADNRPPDTFKDTRLSLDKTAGTLTIDYGAGSYTAYQNAGSQFSYVDLHSLQFRLDLLLFSDKLSFHWYKTDTNGVGCSVDGELLPGTTAEAQAAATPIASTVTDAPYRVNWMPVEAFCTAETIAALPTFTQATITASEGLYTVNYEGGSIPLAQQGDDVYLYTQVGEDGAMVTVSINSHTPEKFSLLYQYMDAAGQMCMANVELVG